MVNKLMIGSMVSVSLFTGTIAQTGTTENTANETPAVSELNPLASRIQSHRQALPETEETSRFKAELEAELKNFAQEKENQKAKKQTEQKRQEKIEEWNKSFPVLEGNGPQANFINEISKDAVKIAHENDIYPSVMLAQAGIESNWGRSGLAQNYNNLMGTKGSWEGKSVTLATGEHFGGADVTINAGFSIYDSWGASLARYGGLLRNGIQSDTSYYSGTWKENADSYKEATAALVGKYATDPNYSKKLNQTIENYDLMRFDDMKVLSEEQLDEIKVEPETVVYALSAPEGFIEIQSDDSLASISDEYDLEVNDLIEWNGLETPEIIEGQWLAVEELDEPVTMDALAQTDLDDLANVLM